MSQRPSVDSTGTLFFTKYSDMTKVNEKDRKRFRSTFQASKFGDQNRMNEIQDMFHNYNLFKYGKYLGGDKKRQSFAQGLKTGNMGEGKKFKNMKEREKQIQRLKYRLHSMKNDRNELFQKINTITKKQRK